MIDPEKSFTTPVGRIVGGSVYNKRKWNHDREEIPEEKRYHVIMLALPKSDPGTQAIVDKARRIAAECFDEKTLAGKFSWKFYDGDAPNNMTKEGWEGCYVFALQDSAMFPVKVVDKSRNDIDPSTVETGYYVRAHGNFKANGKRVNPGIYANLNGVQFIRAGEKIGDDGDFGPTVDEMFGDAPKPEAAPSITQSAMAGPPPPPPAGPVLTDKGREAGVNVEAWLSNGWTMENLKSQGYIE